MTEDQIPYTKAQLLAAVQAFQIGMGEIGQRADAMADVAVVEGIGPDALSFLTEIQDTVTVTGMAVNAALGK